MMLPQIYNYDIGHPLDRVGQQETFEIVMDWFENRPEQYMLLMAPTGSGKTAIVAEMAKYAKLMTLARTKVLLDSVYKGDYNFDQLRGKLNHACRYSPHTHKADVCGIPDEFSRDEQYRICQDSGCCSYYVEYNKFCRSHKAVTTYAKFVSDRQPYNEPDLYVFDECHEVPDLVIEQSGVDINTRRNKFLRGFGDLHDDDDMGFEVGIQMMRKIYGVALKNAPKKKSNPTVEQGIEYKRQVMRHKKFLERIESSANLMIQSENDDLSIWHYSSKNNVFSAKPMTAAYHLKTILNTGKKKTLLMTATMTPMLAEMIGLSEDEYIYCEVPQQYPIRMRPVWDLGQPGMGKKATDDNPGLFQIQALKIANILRLRPDVSSVILTTSKVKANNLVNRLRVMGFDTFLTPEGIGTDNQLKAWEDYRKPGAVCVAYNFWEGVSLDDDHNLFIAGIKYPDLGSPFERARADRSWPEFNYRGAVNVVQGAGRIQRGYVEDYLPTGRPDNLVGKMVFIADGNWKNGRIKKQYPGDFLERVRPWF